MGWMSSSDEGVVVTIVVDMTIRRAVLDVSEKGASRRLEPYKVWENPPEKVWIGVTFKRVSACQGSCLDASHPLEYPRALIILTIEIIIFSKEVRNCFVFSSGPPAT